LFEAGGFREMLDEAETRVLEDHMGFRGQWDEHRRFQFDFIRSHGLQRSSQLIEFGCGPLTLGIPIIQYLDSGRQALPQLQVSSSLAWTLTTSAGRNALLSRLII
jgi:hypothetical protein